VHVIVLGIDPGVANTGYGVVASDRGRLVALDGGVIATAPGQDAGARLADIHLRVGELIDEYRPDAVAVEDLYFGTNARSAFAVGQARGVVVLAAGQRGVHCSSYTPQQVKGAVCGSGRAPKDQVQRMVQTLLMLPELPRPDHAADALAVAICHANGAPMAAALAGRSPSWRARSRCGGWTTSWSPAAASAIAPPSRRRRCGTSRAPGSGSASTRT
jgi:crossover junction endodeoxyribonuclease RuvC